MTDRPNTDNTPLFQNMDEQEQVYAPQQVPGATMPDAERDQGDSAGEAAAGAVATANLGAGNPSGVTSASGPGTTDVGALTPVVPVRPDASATTPIITPASSYRDADAGDATGHNRL